MLGKGADTDLVEREPAERDGLDSPRERLRCLLDECGRGAAENQEARGQRLAIDKHAKDGEELRATLNLVDHHDAAQRDKAVSGSASRSRLLGSSRSK